jgi:hypothetical protein
MHFSQITHNNHMWYSLFKINTRIAPCGNQTDFWEIKISVIFYLHRNIRECIKWVRNGVVLSVHMINPLICCTYRFRRWWWGGLHWNLWIEFNSVAYWLIVTATLREVQIELFSFPNIAHRTKLLWKKQKGWRIFSCVEHLKNNEMSFLPFCLYKFLWI